MATELVERFFWSSRLLIITLILSLIFPFSPQRATAETKPIYTTVMLGVYTPSTKPKVMQGVLDVMHDEFSLKETFQLVARDKIKEALLHLPLSDTGHGGENFDQAIDVAKNHYANFAFAPAIDSLEKALAAYRSQESAGLFHLVDAYQLLGNIYLGMGNKKKAEKAFREAIRLAPTYEPSAEKFSPSTLRFYSDVQAKAKQDFAKAVPFEVHVQPSSASVYVNGVLQANSSNLLYPEGEHFVSVYKDGYKNYSQKIVVKGKKVVTTVNLERVGTALRTEDGIMASATENPASIQLRALEVAKSIGAQKLILVKVDTIGWKHKIETQLIDINQKVMQATKNVEVGDIENDVRSAANVVAVFLAQAADKEVKKGKAGDVIVIGSKKKKSLAKSPVLWGILGAVLVGAGVGVALMGGGGGSPTGPTGTTVDVTGAAPNSP